MVELQSLKQAIEEHIKHLLKQFLTTKFVEAYRNRIDEMFLLYSSLYKISFVRVCEEFGVDYNLFNDLGDFIKGDEGQERALMKLRRKLREIYEEICEEKEFNLSEKILAEAFPYPYLTLFVMDVKEFIKRYDELFSWFLINHKDEEFHMDGDDLFHHFTDPEEFSESCEICKEFLEKRDKLIGNKLI